MKAKKTTLIITGMHRSGTSLLASYMHHAGFAMGDLMVGPDTGNKEGHYEDWDFVHFHNDLLRFNGLDYLADSRLNYNMNEYFHQRAEHLIQLKDKLHYNWGWKDPRTCLFLPLWHPKIQNPRYIFVIRSYAEIAESLFQREVDRSRGSKIYPLRKLSMLYHKKQWIKKYILSYINHNKRIISFCQQIPKENYIVLSRRKFVENNDIVFQFLNNHWLLSLRENPFNKVYKSEMDHQYGPSNHNHLAANLVEQKLYQMEAESMEKISSLAMS